MLTSLSRQVPQIQFIFNKWQTEKEGGQEGEKHKMFYFEHLTRLKMRQPPRPATSLPCCHRRF